MKPKAPINAAYDLGILTYAQDPTLRDWCWAVRRMEERPSPSRSLIPGGPWGGRTMNLLRETPICCLRAFESMAGTVGYVERKRFYLA